MNKWNQIPMESILKQKRDTKYFKDLSIKTKQQTIASVIQPIVYCLYFLTNYSKTPSIENNKKSPYQPLTANC
jgi:hypothetical protein